MGSTQPVVAVQQSLDRVLLVEDNPVIAMNTEVLLQELGVAKVMVAMSLSVALDLVSAHRFDFAILDLDLDGETSVPVAEQLVDAQVPIIFSTGYGDLGDLPNDLDKVPLLRKPYTFTDLKKIILQNSGVEQD
jgi:two-component SAPR family response regulator